MTREFPDRVNSVGRYLTFAAGSYLHTVTKSDWLACTTCALPVDGYEQCFQCRIHSTSGEPVADRIGLLIYADAPSSQTYRMMRDYKEPRTQPTFEPIVKSLLAVGLGAHFGCAVKLGGLTSRSVGWAVVPSTKERSVLADLVRALMTRPASEVRVTFTGTPPDRALRPEAWSIGPHSGVPEHVVVIDDSWVSGSSSQSLAVALKRAGAEQVSILSVARVLSPSWKPNEPFLRNVLPALAFGWKTCPWTFGDCP